MQYTPNYNLITVEGTDVVNPLVQMNPNFTDIDAAMFANKQASIGTATEVTVGTVHDITRSNTDSNYFKFTATSNWNTGDTMTVDGVTVSVFLTDGRTPTQGCYVINSEVFAMINGSRVTLYTAPAYSIGDLTDVTVNSPVNAETLVYDGTKWINGNVVAGAVRYGGGSVKDALDNMFVTTQTIGTTSATGNIMALAPAGNVFPISCKLTAPSDCYVIPYWSIALNAWAFRVKAPDDTPASALSVTIDTIWLTR